MKWVYGIATAALLALWLAAAHGTGVQIGLANAHLGDGPGRRLAPLALFLDAFALPKLVMIVCILMLQFAVLVGLVGVIMALARKPRVARFIEFTLGGLGALSVLLGVLAWFYGGQMTARVIADTGITDALANAPLRAESLLSLSLGAFTGLTMFSAALVICLLRLLRTPRPAAA